jgi:uncharacterized repeat protein (TIGR02543 family)
MRILSKSINKILITLVLLFVISFFNQEQVLSNENKVEMLYQVETIEQAHEIEELYQVNLLEFSSYGFAIYEVDQDIYDSLVHSGFTLNSNMNVARPSWMLPPEETNEDPFLKDQYALDLMNVFEAWTTFEGDLNILIAVIDTGIDINHSEFSGRLSNYLYNSRTKQEGLEYVIDDNGHGTLVSGVIAANKNNSIGIAGIVSNSKLMVIKANNLDDLSTTDIDESKQFSDASIIEGIYYAVDNGAHIINLSLGGTYANPLTKNAIDYARSKGVILVAASGNDGNDSLYYPASFDGVISVGAVDSNKTIWENSNYNQKVDIVAPGVNIVSTSLDNKYQQASGTSLAAPQITGVIALMLGYFDTFTSEQIISQLLNSTTDLGVVGYDPYYGFGLVNASISLQVEYVTINFVVDENIQLDPILVIKDIPFLVDEPLKVGSIFEGWFYDENFTQTFIMGENTTNINLTLYAKFEPEIYKVNFITSGTVVNELEVFYGDIIDFLPVSNLTGYQFVNWYLDNEYSTIYQNEPITSNITLYAKFEILTFEVNFYIDSTIDKTLYIDYLNLIDLYQPEHEFPFISWYTDNEFSVIYQNEPVVKDINLYARFNDGQIAVSFFDSKDNLIYVNLVYYGESASSQIIPIKENSESFSYQFVSWDKDLTTIYADMNVFPVYEKTFLKDSIKLNKGIDTIFDIESFVDAGIDIKDLDLSYEVQMIRDELDLSKYVIYYDVYDANDLLYTYKRIVKVVEQSIDVEIDLNLAITTIPVGKKYIETGAITNIGEIEIISNVDISKAGVYQVTYQVTIDEIVFQKTRFVYVLETNEFHPVLIYYRKEDEVNL